MGSVYISDVLGALSDDKSLTLFNMVAFTLSRDTRAVMKKLGIRKKQYYSRMNRLINAGLVTRKRGEYFLTSFGKVVYQFHLLIGQAVENYWKLKAIDSLESKISFNELSAEVRKKMIDALIESRSIKNILLEYKVALDASSGPQKVRVIGETPAAL
jgi:predicted transcriptional regulator